jgi:8-oxo-dGTP pyrophosphatase MutT (NUDIX family)
MYPVIENWGDAPLAQIDRSAVPWFGVKGFGIHVNGFVRKPDGIYLWIAERAADRQVDPGKLDNLIGGGQPIGLTLEDNLCKEAHEEAGIAAPLARTAKPVRIIGYLVERMHGLRNDVLFVYDLELPETFAPRNTDGEVAAFALTPLAEAAALVRHSDRFKFNCNLVVTDFLVRHGFIGPGDGEYAEIVEFLEKDTDDKIPY